MYSKMSIGTKIASYQRLAQVLTGATAVGRANCMECRYASLH